MAKNINKWTRIFLFLGVFFLFFLLSCVSHLNDAKLYYIQAQEYSSSYDTERAVASFKKSLEEVKKEVDSRPSSQALMLKGLIELNLNRWEEAERSFLMAFSYGFDKGQEWAEWSSLYGLASSLQEMGLESSAYQIYEYLISKSKLRPLTILSAQKYTDIALEDALHEEGKDRERLLTGLFRTVQSLSRKDLSCGYFHYLLSQVLSHMGEYRKCFDEAVMAKELGLPSEEILRDNDLQIVFCFERLKDELPSAQWEAFQALYMGWIKRWNWSGPLTPPWKER
jgi:tetratricopeptide (TPR) repeat protein